ncbi:unnamed protein product [Soboliphyme baturini]|uniref:Mitochondrial import inner membrane translocase subunit n=1 Tax=Soboliphyme baturini TaxID=241478 RepID=A0A183IZQ6_9BILA|nr:unnamed protein product [Soboliphyme baturini]
MSDSSSLDLSNISSSQREDLMNKVKVELAVANIRELLQQLSNKCIKVCIKKPGKSLDSSEQKCLAHCVDRYVDSWNLVASAYRDRLEHS